MSADTYDYDLLTYPDRTGCRDHSTSREAAQSMVASAPILHKAVLELLGLYPSGLTVHEAAELAGATVPAIQPRFSELKKLGEIERSGERRKNKSGRSAAVWVIKEVGC